MKRYTLLLIAATLWSLFNQNVYAAANETLALDDDLYEEVEILDNIGKVTIMFVGKPKNSINDMGYSGVPLEGVTVEVYYKKGDTMENIKYLEEFEESTYNLVSDENGEVVISNLPFGFYRYEITSTPFGSTVNQESATFSISILMNEIYRYNFITIEEGVGPLQDEVVDTPVQEPTVEEPVKVETVIKPVVTETTTDNTVNTTTVPDEEINHENAVVFDRFYVAANNDFKIQEEVANEIEKNEELMDTYVTAAIPRKIELSKKDAIEAMKEVRISEAITIATLTYDSSVYKIQKLAELPDDDRKNKLLHTIGRNGEKISNKKAKALKNAMLNRDSKLNVFNKVA